MNRLDDRELDVAIREALHDRAASIHPTMRSLEQPSGNRPRRAHRRLVAAAAAVMVVTATVLGIGLWSGREPDSASRVSSGPVVDGRVHVPLDQEPITRALRESLAVQGFDFMTGADPVVLRPEGHDALLVLVRSPIIPPYPSPQAPKMQGCIAAVVPTSDGFSQPSSSCRFEYGAPAPPDGGLRSSVHDMHVDARDRRSYFAWIDVPEGATRVTYDSAELHAWQVPIHGVAVFPVSVDEGPTLRAFGGDGGLLGERIIEAPEFPSEGYVGPNPAWYNLAATLRFCERAPLDQVDFVVGGDRGHFRMFDPDGGLADVDAREFCRQSMELRPEPQSDILRALDVVDGAIRITYYRLRDANAPDVESNRQPVPDADLRALNEQRRAEVAPICKTNSKASWKIPACQVGA